MTTLSTRLRPCRDTACQARHGYHTTHLTRYDRLYLITRYHVTERATRLRDDTLSRVAKRLPHRLRYWVLITVGVGTIRPDEEVPTVPFTTVLQRFDQQRDESPVADAAPLWR